MATPRHGQTNRCRSSHVDNALFADQDVLNNPSGSRQHWEYLGDTITDHVYATVRQASKSWSLACLVVPIAALAVIAATSARAAAAR